jgi:DNA-binding transcriptional MerR regulator
MLKISDFSRLARVPTATLRYYDQIGLLRPIEIDRFTDYRYYAVDQLPRLNRILALKDLGFTLEQIARLIDGKIDTAEMRGMLVLRQLDAQREVVESQTRLSRVAARLAEIEQEGAPSPYDILLKPVDALWIVSTRRFVEHIDMIGTFCETMHSSIQQQARQFGIFSLEPPAPGLLNLYHADEYQETDIDMEVGAVVAPPKPSSIQRLSGASNITVRELPAVPLVASGVFRGAMETMTGLVRALLIWISANNYSPIGPLRELHLTDESARQLGQNVVEIQLPVMSA